MAWTSPTLRRVTCAIALPGFPLALLIGSLVSPTDSTNNADQLAAVVTHPGHWQAAALLELLAAALVPFAVAGVIHLVQRRGAGLANAAAVLGVLGALGMASIGLRHLFIGALSAARDPGGSSVLDALDNQVGIILFPLMLALPIAWILLAGAAARARFVSRWLVLGAVIYALVDNFPLPFAEQIQGLVGILTFGAIAAAMLRLSDEQWQSPRLPAPPSDVDSTRVVRAHG